MWEVKANSDNRKGSTSIMITVSTPDTTATVADAPAELTDGYHLVVLAKNVD